MKKDRTKAPPRKPVGEVRLPVVKDEYLSNGIPVTVVDSGSQDLCRVEFIYNAGTTSSSHPLIASFANDLVHEGTPDHGAEEIADQLDYYGAFLETEAHFDHASVFLFTLNKHLSSVLPVVAECLEQASYPDKDVITFISNQKQKFKVAEEKVNYICRRKFNEALFGPSHGYGRNVQLKDYGTVLPQDLRDFHRAYYHAGNCRIMVAGKRPKGLLEMLDLHFGKSPARKTVQTELVWQFEPSASRKYFVPRKDALQSAIRIGRILFNRRHPDFMDMQVVNTILGGYFGSRLMANIREDKGFTYGIGSGVSSLLHSGSFVISTEVGTDVCKAALKEIYYELTRLREETVSNEELDTVKNYMLGTYLSSVDGPFQVADKIRMLRQFGLDTDHYDSLIRSIRTITPKRIRELANTWLLEKDLFEVVAGKK
ncbi:MAG: insulinase family protein [Bacteroidia bacterium]|nr:insulinase family protein [Bacteroidia bacterium]